MAFPAPVGTPLGAEQGSYLAYIQPGTRSVDQALEDLLQLAAPMEQQVAAVFDLKDRVGIAEAGPLLLLDAQGETQARRIDPLLAHLDQAPYSPCFGQGVCNPGQVCGVGDLSEAIPLLDEIEVSPAGLAGDVLVPVQDDLRAERGMAGHLDGDVAPVGVHDVEGLVIHVWQLVGQVDATPARALDIPDRGYRAGDQDHEQPTADGVLGEIVLGDVMLALPAAAVDDGDVVRLGEPSNAAAKAASQTHEVRVVELVLGAAHQSPPPQPKPAGRVAQRVVGVQNNAIDTVVSA